MSGALKAFCEVRPGDPGDLDFMRDMLYEAACWRPGTPKPPRDEVLSAHEVAHYVDGWGRPGDAAVVALDPSNGRRAGAAWHRLMPPEDPGYGYVDAATPEVSIGVVPGYRGRGVGGMLLEALMRTARSQGFKALSLGVEADNPALRLYERHGYVKLFDTGGAWTMKADLSTDPATVPNRPLKLSILDERLAVCRLGPLDDVPDWATTGAFFSVVRAVDELSIVCPEGGVPPEVEREKGWRALKLEGPFDLSLVGILASVAAPLAEAGVGIFAVSTYDTDYVLVKDEQRDLATTALRRRGHEVL